MVKKSYSSLLYLFVVTPAALLVAFPSSCGSLHLEGTWETEDFFVFLTKFGFQKTEPNNINDTKGYVFGNITTSPSAGELTRRGKRSASSDAAAANTSKVPSAVLKAMESSTTVNRTLLNASSTSNNNNNNNNVPNSSSKITSDATAGKMKTSAESFVPIKNSTTMSTTTAPNPTATISTRPSSTAITASPKTYASSSSSTPSTTTTTTTTTTTSTTTTTTTARPKPSKVYPATLVVLDRGYFLEFYRNRNTLNKDEACRKMFEQISRVNYDSQCFPKGSETFLRRIPCQRGELCEDDQVDSKFVVKEHQFTYALSDPQPKFWYVSLVACYRDPVTCEWKHSGNLTVIDYDIWLVNGNPYTKNQNPLEYQFSFDRQDTVEIYVIFFMCYLVLFPLQVHAVLRQRHIVPRLFTGSVSLELAAVLANVVHVLKFALNGVGHPNLAAFGDIMDIGARALFMLILLVLAKGWAVTRTELTGKPFIFTIWAMYGIVHILLYVWKETEVDVIEDIDEYQTWPGWLILVLRNLIMVWFLYELKDTMDHEHQPHKLNFFLHFGAASLVWFIYLPIIALIALQISPLWRSKLLLGITYSADCLAFAVMTHLLWPTRSQQYFLLTAKLDTSITDELEEFNEAPHVVNPYSRRPLNHNRYPINYSFREGASSNHHLHNSSSVNIHQNNHQNGFAGHSAYIDDVKDNVPLIIT